MNIGAVIAIAVIGVIVYVTVARIVYGNLEIDRTDKRMPYSKVVNTLAAAFWLPLLVVAFFFAIGLILYCLILGKEIRVGFPGH